MRWKLNRRFLLIVTVAAIIFAVGWFFLHRYQKKRLVGEYLVQATRAEEEEKLDRAARLLRSYVLAVPSDTDARIRYATLLEKIGKTLRAKSDALDVYEQALRQDPDRHDARRRAAELAVELGRFDAARTHVTALLKAFENDGRALFLLGLCQEANKQYEEAAETYAKSCRADPKPAAFVRQAGVLKIYLKRDDTIDPSGTERGPQAVMNELVKALPESFESYLARAAYHKTYNKVNGLIRARADLEIARKLAPDNVMVLLASAEVAVELAAKEVQSTDAARYARKDYWNEARRYLRHGLNKSPKESVLYLALVDVEIRDDGTPDARRKEAIKVLTTGRAEVRPDGLPEILFALAEQYAETGDKAGTGDTVAQLRKLNQNPARIDFLLGLFLVRQQQWYEGSGVLERVRPLLATYTEKTVQIDLLLAQCYGQLGDIDRQVLTYRRAVTAAPLDWRPRFGLAGALAALGRANEAIDE